MKKKILVFHPALAPYRVDFFNAIAAKFNASFYFSLQNVSDQKFDQEKLREKCNFNPNYILSGFDLMGRSFRTGISLIIRKENPDLILCSEYGPVTVVVFIYKLLFRKKFKLYTISDDSVDNSRSRKYLRAFLRNLISINIDGVIFTSNEVCCWYRENVSTKTKTFELPIIHNDIVFREKLAKSLNIANSNILKYNLINKKIILFVGRLVEVKNLPFFIKALAQLKSNDWNLIIVGEGILMDYLKKQSYYQTISDKIHFTGRQEDLELYSWYTFAHILVLPSTYEPFGAVVNEALLGGCKVLCSELAGASSLITKNNGLLFSPYNEKDILACLECSLLSAEFTPTYINKIRENNMPFTFKEKVDMLINNL